MAVYDADWHVMHRDRNVHSARRIVGILLRKLPVDSVVDFGCGDGTWLAAFAERGATRVLGYDGPWNRADILQIRRTDFRVKDLTQPVDPPERSFDLAVCLEVAEHMPAAHASTLLQSLCSHAPVVLFGAAVPRQGGYRHVNEQWQSHWADRFRDLGYRRFDFIRAEVWDDPGVHFWYKQNPALFVREDERDTIRTIEGAIRRDNSHPVPVDVVHPHLFTSISSYEQIAFKPLLRKLVPKSLEKVHAMLSDRVKFRRGRYRRGLPAAGGGTED